ncbi:hypothetical protein HII31_06685 [Pseudocercospora fuligena]|uniref:Ecp2 effector protein domain-containing protein n=1 Tax=Pseudocercospora fuligena TaxID=685502 RepID=A0A8H6VHS9_9PEZI|nr:hypothetical protein HII31_06685 [Pseudocercospora fuligena]
MHPILSLAFIWLSSVAAHPSDHWHYRIIFNRYNTTTCLYQSLDQMIDPYNWDDGVKISEEHGCFEWKDQLSFIGFMYFWEAHVGAPTEHIGDYGKCEIAIYGQDKCAGSAVGWVNNANTRNNSAALCRAMEGRHGKSVKVYCDRNKKPDWDPEMPLAPGFNWPSCKKGPCHPPA